MGPAEDEGQPAPWPPGVVSERGAQACCRRMWETSSSLSQGGGPRQGQETSFSQESTGPWLRPQQGGGGGWVALPPTLEPRPCLKVLGLPEGFIQGKPRPARPPKAPSAPLRMLGRGDRLCTLIKVLSPSLQPCPHGHQLQHPSVYPSSAVPCGVQSSDTQTRKEGPVWNSPSSLRPWVGAVLPLPQAPG